VQAILPGYFHLFTGSDVVLNDSLDALAEGLIVASNALGDSSGPSALAGVMVQGWTATGDDRPYLGVPKTGCCTTPNATT
jgi:hypothetical protein